MSHLSRNMSIATAYAAEALDASVEAMRESEGMWLCISLEASGAAPNLASILEVNTKASKARDAAARAYETAHLTFNKVSLLVNSLELDEALGEKP